MKKTNNFLLLLNIFFLLFYSFQLLVYTDEFALKNLGIFNHAVAGLSEIIGIIFLALSISVVYIWKNNIKGQLPLFLSILLIQVLIFFNFLRYIFTDSPGETTIESIIFNAFIFFIGGLVNFLFILINFKTLK
ncbi:MAG: hypothetical protein CMQ57_01435 [Gammaproteobacteria bacterium]|nr:hypothetical protein [Gammaproteobacteria bacterium]